MLCSTFIELFKESKGFGSVEMQSLAIGIYIMDVFQFWHEDRGRLALDQ